MRRGVSKSDFGGDGGVKIWTKKRYVSYGHPLKADFANDFKEILVRT